MMLVKEVRCCTVRLIKPDTASPRPSSSLHPALLQFFFIHPRVTTAKKYGITQQDIDVHLRDTVEYLYTGQAFIAKRRD